MYLLTKCTILALVLWANYDISLQQPSSQASLLNGPSDFVCTAIGFFAHPTDRHKFYECVRHPANPSQLIAYTYSCLPQECFDTDNPMKCSTDACSKNESSTEFPCLKDNLRRDAQLICQEETLTVLERLKSKMVAFTAFRGDPFQNLRLSLRDMNIEMRSNYARMIENTGKHVYPLMVVTDGEPDYFGVGGVFKVYFKDGTMKRIIPVSPAFEMHKSLSHMVLGVFAIVSPYFHNPNSINWQSPLRSFQQRAREIQHLLQVGETGIVGEELKLALTMLGNVIAYIDETIANRSCDMMQYHTFATKLAPLIEQAMLRAAEAHARDTVPALMKLKEEMGDEEWKKLQVIIPTVWPVSLFNIRLQALEKVMSFDQIKNQVLIVEGASTEAAAITTLGRVVADRAVAQLVWGGLQEEVMRDHVFSLSTRRDLLSSTASRELNKICQSYEQQNKPRCPFSGRSSAATTLNNPDDNSGSIATMLRS